MYADGQRASAVAKRRDWGALPRQGGVVAEVEEYQKALDEYHEIGAYHRSEDQLKWQVLGIAYGGASILAANAVNGRYSIASVVLAAAAAAATTLGTAVYMRLSLYTRWRLERAWELEKHPLEFAHHLHLKARGESHRNRVNSVVRLGYWVPWLAWAGFLAVTIISR